MLNAVRKLIPEEPEVEAHEPSREGGRKPRLRAFASGVTILFAVSIFAYGAMRAVALSPELFTTLRLGAPAVILLILTVSAISVIFPGVATALLTALFLGYLLYRGILPELFLPAVYLGLCSTGCLAWSMRLAKRLEPQSSGSVHTLCFIAGMLFVSTAPFLSAALLALSAHTAPALLAASTIFAGTQLALSRRSASLIFQIPHGHSFRMKRIDGSLRFWVLALLAFSAFMYLFPDAVTGDSDKAYLAYPKFYALRNFVLLSDPAWLANVMSGYHHTQELFFAAGYVLGGDFGLKLLAFTVIVLKAHAVYFIARRSFRLTRTVALLALTSYLFIPIVIELHAVARPENLLTLVSLYLFYFADRLYKIDGKDRETTRLLVLACIWLSALAVSIKLTGLYLAVAAVAVSLPPRQGRVRRAVASLRPLSPSALLLLTVSALCGLFWFLRNKFQFGVWLNMPPYEQYHLTIWFPPVRSLAGLWLYLSESLVQVKGYTEFPVLGYGLLGLFLFPAQLWALTRRGTIRRASLFSLLVTVLLISSTRQIRYLAPVVPLMVLTLFALLASFRPAKARDTGEESEEGAAQALVFVASFLFAIAAYAVLAKSEVAPAVAARIETFDEPLWEAPPSIATLNRHFARGDRVLSPYFDSNYFMNAPVMRDETIRSLADLRELQLKHSFSHWLLQSYFTQPENIFFNDPELMETISEPVVKAEGWYGPSNWHYLFRFHEQRFGRLLRYAEAKGWDLAKTVVVSAELKRRFPHLLVLGEEILIPGLPHTLYRLRGMWREDYIEFYDYGGTSSGSAAYPLAWFFEDLKADPKGITRIVKSDNEGELTYSFSLPELPADTEGVLEVYARGELHPKGALDASLLYDGNELDFPQAKLRGPTGFSFVGRLRIPRGGDASLRFREKGRENEERKGTELRDIRVIWFSSPLAGAQAREEGYTATRPVRRPPWLKELLSIAGGPMSDELPVVWLHEKANGRFGKAPRLKVAVDDQENGERRFRIFVPAELREPLRFKILVSKLTLAEREQARFRCIDAYGKETKELCNIVVSKSSGDTLTLIGDIHIPRLSSDRKTGRFALDLVTRIEGVKPGASRNSELLLILGGDGAYIKRNAHDFLFRAFYETL